jgi:ribosome-binding factor A
MITIARASCAVIPRLQAAGSTSFLALSSTSQTEMGGREEEEQHQQSYLEQQHQQQPSQLTQNIRLEAVKSVGLTQLHNHTQDLISRTRQPLFEENLLDVHGHKRPSIAQIQEANRLESSIIDALEFYSSKQTTFSVRGQCIDLLGVEVSSDLKHAKAYWCLPRSLDLHTLPDSKLEQLVARMQQRLDERGGKIQALVHTRLRAYYPPKITVSAFFDKFPYHP